MSAPVQDSRSPFDQAGQIAELRSELDEFRQLFELGFSRYGEAAERWRVEAAADRALVMPDLGALLEWLMAQADAARRELDAERARVAAVLRYLDTVPCNEPVRHVAALLCERVEVSP